MSSDLKPMPVYFPEDVKQRLRREAFETGQTMSAIVVAAVREKLSMTNSEEGRGSD